MHFKVSTFYKRIQVIYYFGLFAFLDPQCYKHLKVKCIIITITTKIYMWLTKPMFYAIILWNCFLDGQFSAIQFVFQCIL